MSYRVDYNPEMQKRYPDLSKVKKQMPIRQLLLPVLVIVACYGIFRSGLADFFIPGDSVVTTAAFSHMVEDIGAGEPVRQALLDFCKEIIVNAG